jgi:hypothetical protein
MLVQKSRHHDQGHRYSGNNSGFFLLLLSLTLYLFISLNLHQTITFNQGITLVLLLILMAAAFVVAAVWLSTRPIIGPLKLHNGQSISS